jgi:teichuronic acid biosynthesis glycosyltransferase TuaC
VAQDILDVIHIAGFSLQAISNYLPGRETLRILVLSPLFPIPGDPALGVFVLEQLKALRQIGVDAVVVKPIPWPPPMLRFLPRVQKHAVIPRTMNVEGFQVEYPRFPVLPGGRLFSAYGLLCYLCCRSTVRRFLTEHKVDLIHAHTVMPAGFAGVLLGREFNLPVVCTGHGSDISHYPRRSRASCLATKWSLRHTKQLVTVSRDLKRKVASLASVDNVEVVENGADDSLFTCISKREARTKVGLPFDKKMLLFVGNLVPVKGVDILLEAVSKLERMDTVLCVVGQGFLRQSLESLAARLGIAERCMFVGGRPHREIPSWLSAADCLVLSSLSEGFPTILPEAMMCRVPIVATAVGGIPEVVKHQQTGLLVAPGDADALAEAINAILEPGYFVPRMIEHAEHTAKSLLTWHANAIRMKEIYARAVSG